MGYDNPCLEISACSDIIPNLGNGNGDKPENANQNNDVADSDEEMNATGENEGESNSNENDEADESNESSDGQQIANDDTEVPKDAEYFMKHPLRSNGVTPCGIGEGNEILHRLSSLVGNPVPTGRVYGADNEADLLLSRGAAIFDYTERDLTNMFVCSKHKAELTTAWIRTNTPAFYRKGERVTKCAIPALGEFLGHPTPVAATARRFITKDQSQAALMLKNVFIPMGLCKI